MKYGTNNLAVEYGTISFANRTSKITRHYPATNRSVSHDLGRQSTTVSCVVIVKTDTQRIILEQLMNTHIERNLELSGFYYKKVVPDIEHSVTPIAHLQDGCWRLRLSFIALDPIPYDVTTGEALY